MSQSIRQMIDNLRAGTYPPVSSRRRIRSKRGSNPASRKTLKKFTWDSTDNHLNLPEIMTNDNKIFLGVSDFDDLITTQILQRRVAASKQTVHRETTVLCNRSRWSEWCELNFADSLFVQGSASSGFIIEEETDNYISYNVNNNSTTVRISGS